MTTPRRTESFDAYQERALSERCECLHQRRQHDYDAEWADAEYHEWWSRCTVPDCPCEKFTEREDEQ